MLFAHTCNLNVIKLRSCLFINSNPGDRAIFVTALFDTSPETVCFVADCDQEALDIMREERIVPDYIFVELKMPGIDGYQFLTRIKKVRRLRKTPVIVHCNTSDTFLIAALRERGAFAIYSLPYNYRGMCNILSLYLNEKWSNLCLN
jgi:CheY-like chemotaxis protein